MSARLRTPFNFAATIGFRNSFAERWYRSHIRFRGTAVGDRLTELTTAMDEVISFGPFALSVGERQLKRGEAPIQLGSRALDILMTPIEHAGEVVSNKDLIASA